VLIPLTLGWKLLVYPDESSVQEQTRIQQSIVEFLHRQLFVVVVRDGEVTRGTPTIEANAFGCRILVAESAVEGWSRDVTQRYATSADSVFIVYGGKVYDEQPTWLGVRDTLMSKFPRALGLKAQTSPMLTVIATKACQAELLPWPKFS